MAPQNETVSIEGHRLTLTNLDKVLYPSTGTTKGDVLAYYAEIGTVMIPHLANRPATRKRWVHGVGTADAPGEMFFHKNLNDSTPQWVKRRAIQHSTRNTEYPLVNDLATLIWLAQVAALELHVPQWQFGPSGTQRNPDRIVLDLDPGDGAGLAECVEVAGYVRAILTDMGLTALPVTSGSKGIHLYAALDGSQTADQVSAVAHELAKALEADHPDLVVSDMKRGLRAGKVLVDWSQNSAAKTTIAPYSLRGSLEPTVAAPRTWRELASKSLTQLDYREVLTRVKKNGDLLAALTIGHPDSLEPATDRLSRYRSMRSGDKTPEPVPTGPAQTSAGQSFVIQEHHASHLHWDFRLEHEGVLVSWALPKGLPTQPKQNHLAVQTEDHPLEYGRFEGTIPKGQYGAGTVEIWDAGTYELGKWRDGKEVIVTLHGKSGSGLGGARTYALIHTGSGGGKAEQNWLIHLMNERSALPAAAPAAMLAMPGTAADIVDESEWAFEMKWDGIRAISTVEGNAVTLTSRNGHDLTTAYPELAALSTAVGVHTGTFDGEIVALDPSGRPDFGLLQSRMNLVRPREIAAAAKAVPVHYMLFDVLSLDGRSVDREEYTARRELLEAAITTTAAGTVQLPPAFTGRLSQAMATSKELGLEGVVAKLRNGRYETGRRSRSWTKIKHYRAQEVVVAGWRPGNGRRASGVGSLLLGVPDGTRIRYVGRVGTGFTDRMLADILTTLGARSRKTAPLDSVPTADARDAHWVTPDLVAEVSFAEWTSEGRLRQPVWRGWRTDKSVADIHLE